MRPAILAALLLAAVPALPAGAAGSSGADLLPGCRTAAEGRSLDFGAGVCVGTVVTVLAMSQETVARPPFVICKPPGATASQAVKVVLRYMNANPQELQKELAAIALTAMQLVWPCKSGK